MDVLVSTSTLAVLAWRSDLLRVRTGVAQSMITEVRF